MRGISGTPYSVHGDFEGLPPNRQLASQGDRRVRPAAFGALRASNGPACPWPRGSAVKIATTSPLIFMPFVPVPVSPRFPGEGQGWSLGRSPIAGGSLGGLEEAVQGSGVALGLLPRPGHLGRSLFAGVTRRFMTGKISDRPWAEGFAPGSTAASGIIHKWPASSAYGRSEISPPMNRRNPAPRRMARSCGSRCRTRGSDPPLNRLFSSP